MVTLNDQSEFDALFGNGISDSGFASDAPGTSDGAVRWIGLYYDGADWIWSDGSSDTDYEAEIFSEVTLEELEGAEHDAIAYYPHEKYGFVGRSQSTGDNWVICEYR